MRILIAGTVNYPAHNGQAVFTERLAEGLANLGHSVLSVFPSEKGNAYQTLRNGVQIEAIRSRNLNQIHLDSYFSLFSLTAVQQVFDSFQPEIVHIQDHFPLSRDVIQVAQRYPVPLIGTNHFMPENLAAFIPILPKIKPVYNRLMWSWMLDVYNRLDVVTAQSMTSANLMTAHGLRSPVYQVSCGIDLGAFHPEPNTDRKAIREHYGIDPTKKVFLFVGRIDQEKRLDVLLRAIKLLQRDDIQLVISGQGSEKHNLEVLAGDLELDRQVHFTGYIPRHDLPALLNSVDIFTMPSQAELLSIATLEAMACARPVLLANAVALPELVKVGANGYLFEPGNPADAARHMAFLADHPEHWAKMGTFSLEKARTHGIKNTLRQYEHIYDSLLQSSPLPVLAV